MMRYLVLALVLAAGCWRAVTEAPPGTPPLVIKLPQEPFLVTNRIPIAAKWEFGCMETIWFVDLEYTPKKDIGGEDQIGDFDLGIGKTTTQISCKAQKFSATARCVPGPCAVVTGTRGSSRTLELAFGAPGRHALTLNIDNGSIRKSWTTDVEVVQADAIKLECAARVDDKRVRCDPRVQRLHNAVELDASVFARGKRIDGADVAIYVDGKRLKTAEYVPETLGMHMVIARYDGLSAEFPLVVEQE